MTLSAILLLVVLGTCIDILEQLDKAEVVSGEVTQVGYLERRGSRLSRFRNSLKYHWNRMGGTDYKRIQRRNTIGYKPSIIRRLSISLIGRRPSADEDLTRKEIPQRRNSARERKATAKEVENKGGGRNSHGVPCHQSDGVQLKTMKRIDSNYNAVLNETPIRAVTEGKHQPANNKSDEDKLGSEKYGQRASIRDKNDKRELGCERCDKCGSVSDQYSQSQSEKCEYSKSDCESNKIDDPNSSQSNTFSTSKHVDDDMDVRVKNGANSSVKDNPYENRTEQIYTGPDSSEPQTPNGDETANDTTRTDKINFKDLTTNSHNNCDKDTTDADEHETPDKSETDSNNVETYDKITTNNHTDESDTTDRDGSDDVTPARMRPHEHGAGFGAKDSPSAAMETGRDSPETPSSPSSSPSHSLNEGRRPTSWDRPRSLALAPPSTQHSSKVLREPEVEPKRYRQGRNSPHNSPHTQADTPTSPRVTRPSLNQSLTSIPEETPDEVIALSAGRVWNNKGKATSDRTSTRGDSDDDNVRFRRKGERKWESVEKRVLKHPRGAGGKDDVEGGARDSGRSPVAEILLCFSFLRSVRRVIAEGNTDHLFSLSGVRVLSISWIVLGNTVSLLHKNPAVLANNVDTVKMAQTFWFQALMNATFAADTFFVLSGCLVTYHFLRSKSKELLFNPKASVLSFKSIAFFYIHRLMRIVPCYYAALVSYTVLLPYFGNGPRWNGTNQGLRQCREHWWANALFFSNFYKADDMCMPWTYYLVNDFQFYLLSPLILYPLLHSPRVGLLLLMLAVLTQIVSTALLTNNINGNLLSMGKEFFATVYAKPYCRVGTFAVGMGLGYFLHSTERRVFFRKIPLLLGWLMALGVVATVVYVTNAETGEGWEPWSVLQTSLYQAFSRPLWALAVSFIIFVCSVGQGGFVHKLLSWNFFLPLNRITYGVYLLHPILISVVLSATRYPFYLHYGSLIYLFVANLVCSFGLAFFLITLVETPFTSLEGLLRAHVA